LDDPRALASPTIIKMFLASERRATIVYAGDRMWPTLRHGQELLIQPSTSPPKLGDVVLVRDGGLLDVLRVARTKDGIAVAADADPAPPRQIDAKDVAGRIDAAAPRGPFSAAFLRRLLDWVEAVTVRPDVTEDPADTVLQKYDEQAPNYARLDSDALEPSLRARLKTHVPRGACVLVAGSGTGREAFALEELGYVVRGVDFSANMTAIAQSAALKQGLRATFTAADLRTHDETRGSLGAVVFTYDVYSFVPGAADRVSLLNRIRDWLAPSGALFLSARRVGGVRDRAVLTIQSLARSARRRPGEWGDSHTRWLDQSGRLRRSFVRVFSDAQIDREAALAGFRRQSWEGGHGLFLQTDTNS
jgi:SAM-dependent methyltransferase